MARMTCCGACIRWTTFVFGCLIWVGGSGMLGIGIWIRTQDTEFQQLSDNLDFTIGYISVSSFVFFLGLIGTCSILFLKRGLLKIYFVLLLVLLLAEIALAVFIGHLRQEKVEEYVQEKWDDMDDETRIWFQNKLQCCSMEPVILSHASSHDKSCFRNDYGILQGTRREDCYASIRDWIDTNLRMLVTGAAVVGALQVLAMAGVLRLIVLTGATGRMIIQVAVAPLSWDARHGANRLQAAAAESETQSDYSGVGQDGGQPPVTPHETPLTRANSLECWAKHRPKFNHKL